MNLAERARSATSAVGARSGVTTDTAADCSSHRPARMGHAHVHGVPEDRLPPDLPTKEQADRADSHVLVPPYPPDTSRSWKTYGTRRLDRLEWSHLSMYGSPEHTATKT